ncbi:putative receptor like protein 25 [Macadamia integrifolia]|uniref:putative receptor like protein 25 n=1 Tax=Macadamia integrifolia TaxID=60698 RepID=UPI001C52830A|nr:putative receptor like protein 25 [Macadamia integrifolia]
MSIKGHKSSDLKFNSTQVPYYKELVTRLGVDFFPTSTIYKTLDLSNNRFQGEITELIGDLTALMILNLSRNDLTGQIPSMIGNIAELESLDLSGNRLHGLIPRKLTSLTFLSYLNLSQNLLDGPIPQGNQFETFTNDCYIENSGLCGLPLSKKCRYVVEEIVCGTVIGIIVPSEI